MNLKKILLEQKPDALMFGQPETQGYNWRKPETTDKYLANNKKFREELAPYTHDILLATEIVTAFIPFVGPIISAGIGIANASMYAVEGNTREAGLGLVFSALPGIGPAVKMIPKISKLGKVGMTKLGVKLTRIEKLSKSKNISKSKLNKIVAKTFNTTEAEVVQQLNQHRQKIKSLLNTKLGKVAKFGAGVYGVSQVPKVYNAAYDAVTGEVNPSLDNIQNIKPSAKHYELADKINFK